MASDWWRRRAREREALAADAGAEWRRLSLLRERLVRSGASADRWLRVSTGRSEHVLRQLFAGVQGAAEQAEQAGTAFARATPGGIDGASRSELDQARMTLAEFRTRLDASDRAVTALEAYGLRIDRIRTTAPAKLRGLALGYAQAERLLQTRRAEGWAVHRHENQLRQLHPRIFSTDLARVADDWIAVSDRLESAEAELVSLSHHLTVLNERAPALRQWHDHLVVALDAADRWVDEARAALAERARLHHPDSLAPVLSHPDRAAEALTEARQATGRAAEAAGIDQDGDGATCRPQSRLDEAGRALEQANLLLGVALRLASELSERCRQLDSARADAPGRLARCRERWVRFGALTTAHRGDMTPHILQRPARVAVLLGHLDDELASSRPRYPLIAEWCDHLERDLDAYRERFDDQYQHRLRGHAEAARRVREVRAVLNQLRSAQGLAMSRIFRPMDVVQREELEAMLQRRPYHPGEQLAVANEVEAGARRLLARIGSGGVRWP
ncbi:MAG: hypothetical protein R2761_10965 [Acidimicrobiales bacterium]